MNYAVIKSGGKQYKVAVGDLLTIDKVKSDKSQVEFNQVLLVNDNGKVDLGTPLLKSIVKAEVIENKQGEKLRVARYKAKSNYRRVIGFRPQLTKVKITAIEEIKVKATKEVKTKE